MTSIQNIPDDVLLRIISEGGEMNWNFLALKVMILRLKLKLSMMNNEMVRKQCCADLRELFRKSSLVPNAKKDMQIIIDCFMEENNARNGELKIQSAASTNN
ncbi:MAG: hypothetical protein LBS09_10135 [Bacteroidales bacterium]|jgi:hypothetical protein|nr:hypothetical protein [Bacteroidales bacterium]